MGKLKPVSFKYTLVYLGILMFLFPLVNAVYSIEKPLDITIGCSNINCSLSWNITILYPNSSVIINNEPMTAGVGFMNYTITPSVSGTYLVYLIDNGGTETYETSFSVNYSGLELTEARAILYIGFLALLILIFITNFIFMGYLPARNIRDEDGKIMSISYLKYLRNVLLMTGYFLFIGVVYIASNLAFAFLEEELIAKTLFMIFQIAFGLVPVIIIIWVIYIFASMFHDIQFQRMLNRGIFPGGNL